MYYKTSSGLFSMNCV